MTNRKNLINVCISFVLVGSLTMASPAKDSEIKLIKGTSVGHYAKPGAPVDIGYTSQNVDAGESCEVNIQLITSGQAGTMKVTIKIDKRLNATQKIDKIVSFILNKSQNEYPLKMNVSADTDGVYYIRVLVKIDGKGSRAFAVPVYIGEGRVRKSEVSIEKTATGENISVSKAVERVE